MSGPPPTPTALKKLRGNPGQRPIGEEPTPVQQSRKTATALPPELKGDAMHEWCRIADELYDIGLLTVLDRSYLMAYCQAYGMYVESTQVINDEGFTVAGRQGGVVKHPAVSVQKDALDTMLKFGQRFGLSPSDRARLSKPADSDDDSGMAELLELVR